MITNLFQTKSDIIANKIMNRRECSECHKPLNTKHQLCIDCYHLLLITGLEASQVTIEQLKQVTINYNYHLCKNITRRTEHISFRGNKQDRINIEINEDKMNKLVTYLTNSLSKTLFNKTLKGISDIDRLMRRIIYTQLLYSIAYNKLNSSIFRTELHYQVSCITALRTSIRFHSKRHHPSNDISKCSKYYMNITNMKELFIILSRVHCFEL